MLTASVEWKRIESIPNKVSHRNTAHLTTEGYPVSSKAPYPIKGQQTCGLRDSCTV